MGTGKRNFKLQKSLNNFAYLLWFETLRNLYTTRIKWENLPPTCNEEMLERSLFERGRVCMFEAPDMEENAPLFTLPYMGNVTYDIYGYPNFVQPYSMWTGAPNFPMLKRKQFEVGFNTRTREPGFGLCDYYAMKLANMGRIIDVNMQQQKSSAGAFVKNDTQKRSMETALQQIAEGNPYIIVSKEMWKNAGVNDNTNGFIPFNFNIPYISDKVRVEMNSTFNEFLSLIGIENSNMDKRERVNSAETNGNIGLVEMSRHTYLAPREEFAKRCNKHWGLDIKPVFRSDVATLLNEAFNPALRELTEPNQMNEDHSEKGGGSVD